MIKFVAGSLKLNAWTGTEWVGRGNFSTRSWERGVGIHAPSPMESLLGLLLFSQRVFTLEGVSFFRSCPVLFLGWILLLSFLLGARAWANYQVAEIQFSNPQNKPSLVGLRFDTKTMGIMVERKNGTDVIFAILKGQFDRTGWRLAYKGNWATPGDYSSGRFTLMVPMTSETVSVRLVSHGPGDRLDNETFSLRLKEVDESAVRTLANVVPGTEDVHTVDPSKRASELRLLVGLSSIIYKESQLPDLTATLLTPKIGYRVQIGSMPWDLDFNAFYTTYRVGSPTAANSNTAQFLGLNARLGYVPAAIREPWRLSLMIGLYYNRMFASGGNFGYNELFLPELYPNVRYSIDLNWRVSAYVKYVPVAFSFGSDREIAGGIGLSYRSILLSGDISSLIFRASNGKSIDVSSMSINLGLSL